MKKKLILIILSTVVLIAAAYFCWPLSFAKIIEGDDPMIILCIYQGTENGAAVNHTAFYSVMPESDEYIQIKSIILEHKYHRTLRTLTGKMSSESSNSDCYTIYIWESSDGETTRKDGYRLCFSYVRGEVIIDDKSYWLGFWRDREATLLIQNSIVEVLETLEPLEN